MPFFSYFALATLALPLLITQPSANIWLIQRQGVGDEDFKELAAFVDQNMPFSVKATTVAESEKLTAISSNSTAGAIAVVEVADTKHIAVTNSVVNDAVLFDLQAVRKEYRITDKSSDKFRVHSYTRELMKAIGLQLGLKKGCLNPHCAMSEYQKDGVLGLGRNYCPVCLGVVESKFRGQIDGKSAGTK